MAKAMGLARAILGEEGLRRGTHVQAHGTSTPQNRVTESHILSTLAGIHGIDQWPVGAVKAYVGHSMAPAAGDQLAAVLGTFSHGWLPGITTIDHIASDVHQAHLHFPMQHLELAPEQRRAALINAKGFGGNNATGLFLSPEQTRSMLERRWGRDALVRHARRQESTAAAAESYDKAMLEATMPSIYRFGEGVLEGGDLTLERDSIRIPGFGQPVRTAVDNPYSDMTD
jgi:acetoacetyl-[acyl-carrier protein] synthase